MTLHLYHVYTGRSSVEAEVIQQVKPPKLMLSNYYFRNKNMKDVKEQLGYDFDYLYDSGAFSAHTKGLILDVYEYIKKIKNEEITNYINLDVFNDNEKSFANFLIMRDAGLDPIPVIHYTNEDDYLQRYLKFGCKSIAIGGTVPVRNKSEVANHVRMFTWQYPEIEFHLLGSTSPKIINTCNISSCDSSSWIMKAVFGEPKFIPGTTREDKKNRAIYNLEMELQLQRALSKTR